MGFRHYSAYTYITPLPDTLRVQPGAATTELAFRTGGHTRPPRRDASYLAHSRRPQGRGQIARSESHSFQSAHPARGAAAESGRQNEAVYTAMSRDARRLFATKRRRAAPRDASGDVEPQVEGLMPPSSPRTWLAALCVLLQRCRGRGGGQVVKWLPSDGDWNEPDETRLPPAPLTLARMLDSSLLRANADKGGAGSFLSV
ncbi:Hypothetical predicted protein [Olea europaea subsp. europaea]|uniref:Uncharacterized protein n=1 Tax=Olea europaea subsp. europaea TaxID=158383 RepID=A0A8S0RCV3_OLEEU|nr:Hypothetical predicted protein [Olea europaea subsp. europaea]